jgi:hypothetical protein
VNPAPPAGGAARKEAKQRQAAAAKSEEGQSAGAAENDAQAPLNPVSDPSHGSSRLGGDQHAFTRIEHASGPSAAGRAALYTGGLTLAALLLAVSWGAGRPTPRRRRHDLPAPARATVPTRRRW